jgi:hypothetical protein
MRWFIHAVIRWQDARTLEKRYFAQLQNGRRGHSSRRWFKTASQAKVYADRWCGRVNRMAEWVEIHPNEDGQNGESE